MKRIGIYGTVIDAAQSSTSMDELVGRSGLTSAQITSSLSKSSGKKFVLYYRKMRNVKGVEKSIRFFAL